MSEAPSAAPQPAPSNHRPLISRLDLVYTAIVVVLAAIGIAIVQVKSTDEMDHDFKNVLTYICATLCVLSIVGWFWFRSPLPWLLKILVPMGILSASISMFRLDNFGGDMGFDVVFRFRQKADEALEAFKPMAASDRPLAVSSQSDYPRFLGRDLRATITGFGLETDWKAHPPRQVWRQPIGAGWSAFAVSGAYAVTQEQRGDEELVTCYELRTGGQIWAHADRGRHSEVLGGDGPRATPTIDEQRIYAQGAFGILNCLDLVTGTRYWSHNILEEFAAPQINFGRSGSPLIEGDMVIVCAGGGNGQSMVAFNKATGDVLWTAGSERASYASPVAATLAGVRQIVSVNEGLVCGYRATDGEVLWKHDWPSDSDNGAASSQPVPLGDDLLLLSKGYGYGMAIIRILQDGGTWRTDEIIRRPTLMKTKLTNVIIHDGHVYGLSGGILECVHLETGKRQWKGGRYGHGQIMRIDDALLVVSEKGALALVAARPDRYHELTTFGALNDKTWNNPAIAGRLLLVRNHIEAVCYELPVKQIQR